METKSIAPDSEGRGCVRGIRTHRGIGKPPEVWVIKGIVTEPMAYLGYCDTHGCSLPRRGDPEWRFCDTDPATGNLGSSADFLKLEHGLEEYDGYIIHYAEDDVQLGLYERWTAIVDSTEASPGRWPNLLGEICDAAYEQGILGTLIDGIEGRRSSHS